MKESSLSPATRALLDAAKSDGPGAAARLKMWGGVSTATGIAAAAQAGGAAGSTVAAVSSAKLVIAGALFGATAHHRFHQATELTEDVGLYASFAVWLIFGAVFAGPVLRDGWHWRPILYAALSLMLVRMAPVAAALIGTRLRLDTVAFVGWFGPRGLASVVFTLLVFEEFHGASPAKGVAEVATWTIFLSVLAHGLSAGPLASGYARRLAGSPPGIPELEDTPEPRARRRSLHDRGRIPDPAAGRQGA